MQHGSQEAQVLAMCSWVCSSYAMFGEEQAVRHVQDSWCEACCNVLANRGGMT